MKIGFVGLGKLGLPCALGMELRGHTVIGVDPSPITQQILATKQLAYMEDGAQTLLDTSKIRLVGYEELVRESELIFVAVQTPHGAQFEGVTPIPNERADFDYSYLEAAIETICHEVWIQKIEARDVVVISTVLPGTIAARVRTIIADFELTDRVHLAYNPYFIAMGQTLADFLHPEFILLGGDDEAVLNRIVAFYRTIYDGHTHSTIYETTIENAELIKVTYNTFIGMKIAFANTVMEICHKTPGTDCDAVINALSLATTRLISPKYLRGGMGDGGGCHPRDNIALSWLAWQLPLSHDLFYDIMQAREDQTRWLASLIRTHAASLPVAVLGRAFKPNTNITTGSPARLLSHYLAELQVAHSIYDPIADQTDALPTLRPHLYFIATQHELWKTFDFQPGSIILDPFRYLQDNPSLQQSQYIPIGVGRAVQHSHPHAGPPAASA